MQAIDTGRWPLLQFVGQVVKLSYIFDGVRSKDLTPCSKTANQMNDD